MSAGVIPVCRIFFLENLIGYTARGVNLTGTNKHLLLASLKNEGLFAVRTTINAYINYPLFHDEVPQDGEKGGSAKLYSDLFFSSCVWCNYIYNQGSIKFHIQKHHPPSPQQKGKGKM